MDAIEHSVDDLSLLWYLISLPNPFQSLFFQFPATVREWQQAMERTTQNIRNRISQRAPHAEKEFELEEYYLHS